MMRTGCWTNKKIEVLGGEINNNSINLKIKIHKSSILEVHVGRLSGRSV